jgi:catechol 1,2-dioxygenase
MASIQPLITSAIADGRIYKREIDPMIATLRQDGVVDAQEKQELIQFLDLYEPAFSVEFVENPDGSVGTVQVEPSRLELIEMAGLTGLLTPTAQNVMGPYFRRGAPVLTDGNLAPGEAGTKLQVTGRLLDTEGNPIPNAAVDVWQADANGEYSDFVLDPATGLPAVDPATGRPIPIDPPTYRLRGKVMTDANGNYKIDTIQPGYYGGRPMHIHFMTRPEGHSPLITQLYFEGDPLIQNDLFALGNLIKPATKQADGSLSTQFDIVLRKTQPEQ